jgi:hypothetical protein
MGYKSLAEAIILQSTEDLWVPSHRGESQDFFKGDGFRICAEIAGMNSTKRYRFLHLIGGKPNAGTNRPNNAG